MDFPTIMPELLDLPDTSVKKEEEIKVSKEDLFSALDALGFSRISWKLKLLWGKEECLTEFKNLIINPPEKDFRQGFPMEVFKIILKLQETHDQEFPKFVKIYKMHKDYI